MHLGAYFLHRSFPSRGDKMSEKKAKRPSDKHLDCELQLIRTEIDGDVVVTVSGKDAITGEHASTSATFCNTGFGGGRSPKTFRALIALLNAMEEDAHTSPF